MASKSTAGTLLKAERHGDGYFEIQLADGMGIAKLNARAARKVLDKEHPEPPFHHDPPIEPYHQPEPNHTPEPSHPPEPRHPVETQPKDDSVSSSGDEKEL